MKDLSNQLDNERRKVDFDIFDISVNNTFANFVLA